MDMSISMDEIAAMKFRAKGPHGLPWSVFSKRSGIDTLTRRDVNHLTWMIGFLRHAGSLRDALVLCCHLWEKREQLPWERIVLMAAVMAEHASTRDVFHRIEKVAHLSACTGTASCCGAVSEKDWWVHSCLGKMSFIGRGSALAARYCLEALETCAEYHTSSSLRSIHSETRSESSDATSVAFVQELFQRCGRIFSSLESTRWAKSIDVDMWRKAPSREDVKSFAQIVLYCCAMKGWGDLKANGDRHE